MTSGVESVLPLVQPEKLTPQPLWQQKTKNDFQ